MDLVPLSPFAVLRRLSRSSDVRIGDLCLCAVEGFTTIQFHGQLSRVIIIIGICIRVCWEEISASRIEQLRDHDELKVYLTIRGFFPPKDTRDPALVSCAETPARVAREDFLWGLSPSSAATSQSDLAHRTRLLDDDGLGDRVVIFAVSLLSYVVGVLYR